MERRKKHDTNPVDYTNPENWGRRQGITAGVSHVYIDLSNVTTDEELQAMYPEFQFPKTEDELRRFILDHSEYAKDTYTPNE